MISYIFRFHGHGSLRYLYNKGATVRGRLLQLRYIPNNRRVNSRAAVVVSKKVVKSAVKRNRIRRRIYEVLRKNWHAIKAPTDLAVTVFSAEFITMPANEVELHVIELLKQANLYQQPPQSDKIK